MHTRPGQEDCNVSFTIGTESVIGQLEQAGRTLLALPSTGPSTRLVQSGLEWLRDAGEICASPKARLRPAIPNAAEITRMDEVLAWIPLIPIDKYVLRRIVGARSLVNPMTDRHTFTWRRLAIAMGSDHKAIQRWHAQGIDLIVAALRRAARTPASGAQHRPSVPQTPAHHRGPYA